MTNGERRINPQSSRRANCSMHQRTSSWQMASGRLMDFGNQFGHRLFLRDTKGAILFQAAELGKGGGTISIVDRKQNFVGRLNQLGVGGTEGLAEGTHVDRDAVDHDRRGVR